MSSHRVRSGAVGCEALDVGSTSGGRICICGRQNIPSEKRNIPRYSMEMDVAVDGTEIDGRVWREDFLVGEKLRNQNNKNNNNNTFDGLDGLRLRTRVGDLHHGGRAIDVARIPIDDRNSLLYISKRSPSNLDRYR